MNIVRLTIFFLFLSASGVIEVSTAAARVFDANTDLPFSEAEFIREKTSCESLGKEIVRGEYDTRDEFEARKRGMVPDCDRFDEAKVYIITNALLKYDIDNELMEVSAKVDGLRWAIYGNENERGEIQVGRKTQLTGYRNFNRNPEKTGQLSPPSAYHNGYFDGFVEGKYILWNQTGNRREIMDSQTTAKIMATIENGGVRIVLRFNSPVEKARKLKSIEDSLGWKFYAKYNSNKRIYDISEFELIDNSSGANIVSFMPDNSSFQTQLNSYGMVVATILFKGQVSRAYRGMESFNGRLRFDGNNDDKEFMLIEGHCRPKPDEDVCYRFNSGVSAIISKETRRAPRQVDEVINLNFYSKSGPIKLKASTSGGAPKGVVLVDWVTTGLTSHDLGTLAIRPGQKLILTVDMPLPGGEAVIISKEYVQFTKQEKKELAREMTKHLDRYKGLGASLSQMEF